MTTRERARRLREAREGESACLAALVHGPHNIIEGNLAMWRRRIAELTETPTKED